MFAGEAPQKKQHKKQHPKQPQNMLLMMMGGQPNITVQHNITQESHAVVMAKIVIEDNRAAQAYKDKLEHEKSKTTRLQKIYRMFMILFVVSLLLFVCCISASRRREMAARKQKLAMQEKLAKSKAKNKNLKAQSKRKQQNALNKGRAQGMSAYERAYAAQQGNLESQCHSDDSSEASATGLTSGFNFWVSDVVWLC